MSERPIFTPSGILARTLAFAARSSPKGLNVVFAAGYGICEILGASVLFSSLWPIVQSNLKEKLSVSSKNLHHGEEVTATGSAKTEGDSLP